MLSAEQFNATVYFAKKKHCSAEQMLHLVCYQYRNYVSEVIQNGEWLRLLTLANMEQSILAKMPHFNGALAYLKKTVEDHMNCMKLVDVDYYVLKGKLLLILRAGLLVEMPQDLKIVLDCVYEKAFGAYVCCQNRMTNSDDSDVSSICEVSSTAAECICAELMETFQTMKDHLVWLELLDRLASNPTIRVAYSEAERHVKKICAFDMEHLESLLKWVQGLLSGWLADSLQESPSQSSSLPIHKERLLYFVHECYAKCLIDQLFDILVDFPDSAPIVGDLSKCLAVVPLRVQLIQSLRASVATRLLHPGVNTPEILTAYVQAVKCLRALDPTGIIMNAVCSLITQYLRERGDTVRCIVSVLTEKRIGDMDTSTALLREDSMMVGQGNLSGNWDPDSDDDAHIDEHDDWRSWQPDPSDVLTGGSRRGRRAADVFSMLVSVYGTKDLFVKEYAQLLSERLLSDASAIDLETEERYLELLKARFGDSEMHQCEVMMKDVRDSHRLHAYYTTDYRPPEPQDDTIPTTITATVISSHFWPQRTDRSEEKFQLPTSMQTGLDAYRQAFECMKADRTLEWLPHLGSVEIELDMGDKPVTLNVSPFQAALILLFQEKACWSAEALAARLQTTSSSISRRLYWWSMLGVLRESRDEGGTPQWELNPTLPPQSRLNTQREMDPEDDMMDDSVVGAQPTEDDEVEQYWPYISGLLRNLDSLKAERLHTLLQMFASPGRPGPSLATVTTFLQKKVQEQVLLCTGGAYKLPKT